MKGPKATTLDTTGYAVDDRDMPFRYELLQVLVNPNVAFLLLLIGLLGIALEAVAPGTIVPGAIGASPSLLGLIGTVQLPVAAIGVVLLSSGSALIVAEAHLPTGGILGVAGVAALIGGGLLLFDTGDGAPRSARSLVVAVAVVLGVASLFVGQRGRSPPATSRSGPARRSWSALVARSGRRSTRSARCSSRGRSGGPRPPTATRSRPV